MRFQKVRNFSSKVLAGATLALVSASAMAQGGGDFDVSDAVASITAGKVPIVTICGALLVLVIIRKVWAKIGAK